MIIDTRKRLLSDTAEVTPHIEVKHLCRLQTLRGGREVTVDKHLGYAGSLRLRL